MSGPLPPTARLDAAYNLDDFEALARESLSAAIYDFIAGGADDEVTLRSARAAFERVGLVPHILVDANAPTLHVELLGRALGMPILIAPTALHGLIHLQGELATARAAAAAGTVMVLSTISSASVEDVAATGARFWYQVYLLKDRGLTRELLARAQQAGCEALVLTVDAPRTGRRLRDVRNGFALPWGLEARGLAGLGSVAGEHGAPPFSSLLAPNASWHDLAWLMGEARVPVLLKGVLRPDDAVRAVAEGAAGIVISNHGGRQLDTTPAPLDVLPAIAEALAGHGTILIDGGIRRGTDVVKAIALGAQAVLVGRPVLWGLAAGGQAGVERVLEMLRDELALAMTLAGCPTIDAIGGDLVWSRHQAK